MGFSAGGVPVLCPMASASPGMCLLGSAWCIGVAPAALTAERPGMFGRESEGAAGAAAGVSAAGMAELALRGAADRDGVMGTSRLVSFTSSVSPFFTGSVKSTGWLFTRMVKLTLLVAEGGLKFTASRASLTVVVMRSLVW